MSDQLSQVVSNGEPKRIVESVEWPAHSAIFNMKAVLAATGAICAVSFGACALEYGHLQLKSFDRRDFVPGSVGGAIMTRVSTGDIVLFSHEPDPVRPLKTLLHWLQRAASDSKFDHIAVVIKDEHSGLPYLLECTMSGVQLLPYDQRLLHSSASQVALRQLDLRNHAHVFDSRVLEVEQLLSELMPGLERGKDGSLHLSSIVPQRSAWNPAALWYGFNLLRTHLSRAPGIASTDLQIGAEDVTLCGRCCENSGEMSHLRQRMAELEKDPSSKVASSPKYSSLVRIIKQHNQQKSQLILAQKQLKELRQSRLENADVFRLTPLLFPSAGTYRIRLQSSVSR